MRKCTMHLLRFVHQLKPSTGGFMHLARSHRAICRLFVRRKCKSKHLPSAACLSSQVSPVPSSTLPRIILLTVVTFGSVVSAPHSHQRICLMLLVPPPCNLCSRSLPLHPCWKEMVNTGVSKWRFCSGCCFCVGSLERLRHCRGREPQQMSPVTPVFSCNFVSVRLLWMRSARAKKILTCLNGARARRAPVCPADFSLAAHARRAGKRARTAAEVASHT